MPSLHAAYPLMLMLFFWPAGRFVRILLGSYTLAMAFTLVYGGEHFVIDILVGWVMALLAVRLVGRAARLRERQSALPYSSWSLHH
jgi:membrane-associated phospholipid phosphatase